MVLRQYRHNNKAGNGSFASGMEGKASPDAQLTAFVGAKLQLIVPKCFIWGSL